MRVESVCLYIVVQLAHSHCWVMYECVLVLLRCHFFQDQSVLLGVSMKKPVVGSVSVFIPVHHVPLADSQAASISVSARIMRLLPYPTFSVSMLAIFKLM